MAPLSHLSIVFIIRPHVIQNNSIFTIGEFPHFLVYTYHNPMVSQVEWGIQYFPLAHLSHYIVSKKLDIIILVKLHNALMTWNLDTCLRFPCDRAGTSKGGNQDGQGIFSGNPSKERCEEFDMVIIKPLIREEKREVID